VYNYYDQACTHGLVEPLLVMKQNKRKPLVVLDAEAFFDIISKEHNK
jgi:hypothetical protein